jgi:chromosomal replication initiator protein
MNSAWASALKIIQGEINTQAYNTWFENTKPISFEDNTFTLGVETDFARDWLNSRFHSLITNSLLSVLGSHDFINLNIVKIEEDSTPVNKKVRSLTQKSKTKQKGDFNPELNPKYTFDSFVTGSSNRFAHAAALAVAENPSKTYNPLFVYGGAGLGKTHLLQAIGHYIYKNYNNLFVKYVSTEEFLNDFINSIKDKTDIVFQNKYRNTDVLLVDDIQFLENKDSTQEAFFHTFNSLHNSNKQIVITSDRPPKDIATLEDRLRSRFEWGLITDIQPPDIETRIAILRKNAEHEKISLPEDVAEFIASKMQTNIRELEGALIRVSAYASLTDSSINLELATGVLKDLITEDSDKPITIDHILKEVSRFYSVPLDKLISPKRAHEIAHPRQIAMFLAHELTDTSLPKIGEKLGGRDHTTVIYAIKKVSDLINKDKNVYRNIQKLTSKIKIER